MNFWSNFVTMKNLPLNMLRAFAAVYESGGIRPAARQLGVTHSSVSRFVSDLEGWAGTQLLERHGGKRSVSFTPEGEALGRAVLKSLSELERAVNTVKERHTGNSVTIETTPSFAARWLLPRLEKFEADNNKIELSIVVDQRLSDPSEERSDIAIRMGQGPWAGFKCTALMDDALYPVMSKTFWENANKPDKPADLLGLRLIHDRDPSAAWSLWRDKFGPIELNVGEGPRYTSSDLVLRSSEQGLGVALVRHRFAKDALENGSLVRPFDGLEIPLPNSIWIVHTEGRAARYAAQRVIDWLINEGKQQSVESIHTI